MNKTVIEYKIIDRVNLKTYLRKLWQDLWQLDWFDSEIAIFSKKVIIKIEKKLTIHESAFEKFWNLYPKKTSKKVSEQKFMLLDKNIFDNLFTWLELYIRSKQAEIKSKNLQYILDPSTWINQERWTDEISVNPNIKTGIDRDKARIQKQEQYKKEALEREENIIKKEKLDTFIKELHKSNPKKYSKISKKMDSEISEKIKGKHRLIMLNAKIRAKIYELYLK